MNLDAETRERLLTFQRNESTEYHIYRRRFLEMAGLSLSISGFSFGLGYLLRAAFGIEA